MVKPKKMVNLSPEEIQSRCKLYNIGQETYPYDNSKSRNYYTEKEQLEQKIDANGKQAYTEEQINRLIFRKASRKTVSAINDHHDTLIGLGLTPQQIYQIANHDGGANNLTYFLDQSLKLRAKNSSWEEEFDITILDAIHMCSYDGGAKNLTCFLEQTLALKANNSSWKKQFDIEKQEAIRMCSHDCGAKNLMFYINQTLCLKAQKSNWKQAFGIQKQYAVRICSQQGGAKKMIDMISSLSKNKKSDDPHVFTEEEFKFLIACFCPDNNQDLTSQQNKNSNNMNGLKDFGMYSQNKRSIDTPEDSQHYKKNNSLHIESSPGLI